MNMLYIFSPAGGLVAHIIHGNGIFNLYLFDLYGFNIGKYTIPMGPMVVGESITSQMARHNSRARCLELGADV